MVEDGSPGREKGRGGQVCESREEVDEEVR
jgi:hypothetical protein